MSNMPKVKIEIVAVSRDCFPESLSVNAEILLAKHFEGPKNVLLQQQRKEEIIC